MKTSTLEFWGFLERPQRQKFSKEAREGLVLNVPECVKHLWLWTSGDVRHTVQRQLLSVIRDSERDRTGSWCNIQSASKCSGFTQILIIIQRGLNSFKSGQDWSEFLKEMLGLVRIPLGVVRIGQNPFWSGQDSSEFLYVRSGLVRIPLEVVTIGQNFFRNGQDWSEFLLKCLGFVRIPLRLVRICQNSLRC